MKKVLDAYIIVGALEHFGPICGKKYVRKTALNKHELNVHGHVSASEQIPAIDQEREDHVYNYTHQLQILLLLLHNQDNAIHLGDGGRLIQLYKLFYLYFKVSNCPEYAYGNP